MHLYTSSNSENQEVPINADSWDTNQLNLGIWWALDVLASHGFSGEITIRNRGDSPTGLLFIILRCATIFLYWVHPMTVMGSRRKPVFRHQIIVWMCVKGFVTVLRSNCWTEQGLHYMFSIRKFPEWYSTNRTCRMLLQPYVYTGYMEGVPTIREDPQYVFAMVFWKANWAPDRDQSLTFKLARCLSSKKNRTHATNRRKKKKIQIELDANDPKNGPDS